MPRSALARTSPSWFQPDSYCRRPPPQPSVICGAEARLVAEAARHERRRLAAILAADVVGYAALIAADEAGTLAQLRGLFREAVQPLVARHGGRVFRLLGDALLAEFPSAVEALRCAIALQVVI